MIRAGSAFAALAMGSKEWTTREHFKPGTTPADLLEKFGTPDALALSPTAHWMGAYEKGQGEGRLFPCEMKQPTVTCAIKARAQGRALDCSVVNGGAMYKKGKDNLPAVVATGYPASTCDLSALTWTLALSADSTADGLYAPLKTVAASGVVPVGCKKVEVIVQPLCQPFSMEPCTIDEDGKL